MVSWKRAHGVAARAVITASVFGYLLWRADVTHVLHALLRIPLQSTLAALAALAASISIGILRWRALLKAFGARSTRFGILARWYLLAGFYNLLPSGVGGDLVRGYGTRVLFDDRPVRSLSVVFVERVLGFSALLGIAGTASLARPSVRGEVLLFAALGGAAAIAAVLAVSRGTRISKSMPPITARWFNDLPELRAPLAFGQAALLSLLSQLCTAAAGHFLIVGLVPSVRWSDSLVVFPVATVAAFFPLTIAGAGARDAALVLLLGHLGVSSADALGSSLALLACHLTVAASGAFVRAPRGLPMDAANLQPKSAQSRGL
jgi:hypothetical protein